MQVFAVEVESLAGEKSFGSATARVVKRVATISREEFATNLRELCEDVQFALQAAEAELRSYELEEVEIVAEITAKGEVWLVGGVGAEAKGGVKLVFKRISDRK